MKVLAHAISREESKEVQAIKAMESSVQQNEQTSSSPEDVYKRQPQKVPLCFLGLIPAYKVPGQVEMIVPLPGLIDHKWEKAYIFRHVSIEITDSRLLTYCP